MPSWIGDKLGAHYEDMWTKVRDDCESRGGSNCEAQATSVVVEQSGYTPEGKSILKKHLQRTQLRQTIRQYLAVKADEMPAPTPEQQTRINSAVDTTKEMLFHLQKASDLMRETALADNLLYQNADGYMANGGVPKSEGESASDYAGDVVEHVRQATDALQRYLRIMGRLYV